MKSNLKSFLLLLCAFFLCLCGCSLAFAQGMEPVGPGVLANPLYDLLEGWLGHAGLSIVALIGLLRLGFKPIVTAIEAFVAASPGLADDIILQRVESSRAFKITCWLVDYLTSIKVGTQRSIPADEPTKPKLMGGTISALLCGLALLGFTGCASLTSSESLPTKIKTVAYIGTAEALRAHPEWKPAFATAAADLKLIETQETLDMVTIVAVLQSLPIKELKGDRAVICVTAATLLLDDATLQVKNPAQARTIAGALRAGIELGAR